jgi:hypothetical protein
MGVRQPNQKGRNELCACGSGLKTKWCHGDVTKQQLCNQIANKFMFQLIVEERKKRGLQPYMFTCESCGQGTDRPVASKVATATPTPVCPSCGSTKMKKYEPPKPVEKPEDKSENESGDESEKNSKIILTG